MAYVTRAELAQLVPEKELVRTLDDNEDGREDAGAFDRVASQVSDAVDAYLAGRYSVPFATPPALVKEAARTFAAELCWQRRGLAREQNPWTGKADHLRRMLEKVSAGDVPLSVESPPAGGGGTLISEDAGTYGTAGSLML